MNWAIVENGIVTNIIVANKKMAEKLGARPVYEGINIGAEYSPPPEPDLQADMAELLIDLAYRTTLLELGVSE